MELAGRGWERLSSSAGTASEGWQALEGGVPSVGTHQLASDRSGENPSK